MSGVIWRDLGRVPYAEALEIQRKLAQAKKEGVVEDDVLFLVEHPPVITHGRSTSAVHVVESPAELDRRGVQTVEIERGGDVTYHGPGQVVGYPIFDLTRFREDLHWYLRSLEDVLIRTLGSLEIRAARAGGLTGVWVGEGLDGYDLGPEGTVPAADGGAMMRAGSIRKVASIGIHASRWITMHGFALNHTDEALEGFEWIVPCGLEGVSVTSIESEGRTVDLDTLKREIVRGFENVFNVTIEPSTAP